MNRMLRFTGAVGTAAVTGALLLTAAGQTATAQGRGPAYRNTPLWPQPLPNHWVFGSITGVAVDAQDHIWVTHRGADSLEGNEKGMMQNPPTSSVCCTAAPFVLEFDQAGKVVSSFGGPGQGYNWVQSPGSLAVDGKGNVWITGAGLEPAPPAPAGRAGGAGRGAAPAGAPPAADAHVLKFDKAGKFLLQIGKPGTLGTGTSQDALNRPSAVAVDTTANEVYIADKGSRRIAVFDSETGAYKRSWGAYGEAPGADPGPYDPAAPAARQFRDVSCVEIGKDNNVYVCDRSSNRIQVFSKDGKFVKEAIIRKDTKGVVVTGQFGVVSSAGSVWDIAFSNDAQQRYIFVADGHNKQIVVLDKATLAEVSAIGDGGKQPGRFVAVGSIAVDSRGNIYTGEQHHGKRVQRFVPGR
jgi:DNA-binding beta-propeller fold protein YncE